MDSEVKDIISYKSLFRVLLFIVGVYVFYVIRDIIGILFVAVVLSSAISPWVASLQKRGMNRTLSILVLYLGFLIVVGGVIALLIPLLISEFTQLAKAFPDYYQRLSEWVAGSSTQLSDQSTIISVQQGIENLPNTALGALSSIVTALVTVFGGLAYFILVLVLSFYMTSEEDGVKKFISFFIPLHHREYVGDLILRIQRKMGLWLRAQLVLMASIGILTFVGLSLFGVKYAVVLSLLAGLTEIIPYVGPVLGAVPAIMIAFLDSPVKGVLVMAMYVLIQQVENHFLVPKIMQKAVGLHPLLVIVAILLGAKFGGVVGALLAVPVAAAVVMLVEEYWKTKTTNSSKA